MNKHIFFIIAILIATTVSGCMGINKITEKSPVLEIHFVVEGTYSRPIIDVLNTTRSIEYLSPLKQLNSDKTSSLPSFNSAIFYNQDKISHGTAESYHGPGNYTLKYTFIDGKPVPKSSNESIIVLTVFTDTDGTLLNKEYLAIRWE